MPARAGSLLWWIGRHRFKLAAAAVLTGIYFVARSLMSHCLDEAGRAGEPPCHSIALSVDPGWLGLGVAVLVAAAAVAMIRRPDRL